MSVRYQSGRYADQELDDVRDGGDEREISLGTATILGIFFALTLICALFFGFGYSMGRKSAQQTQVAAEATDTTLSDNSTEKPSGLTARQSPAKPSPANDENPPAASASANDNDHVAVKNVVPTMRLKFGADQALPPATVVPSSLPATVAVTPATVAAGTPGSAMVQVAAVSHQEDADVLAAALKRKGYSVAIRQAPQDKLLHVQIGPFASRKDAAAIQQRLQTDGYNAIVK